MIEMIKKRWIEPQSIDDKTAKSLNKYDNLVQQLLYARGIRTGKEADSFMKMSEEQLHEPTELFDTESAVKMIESAIKSKKKIYIHGDFDVDGISATAILWEYLYRERGANVLPYIPSRIDEGYGMSEKSVSAIVEQGGELIITVDCGIRDIEIINKFRKSSKNPKGVEFIVTDHHEPGEKIPRYIPVVHPMHPKQKYPESNIAGAAVAWKLVAAIEKSRNPKSFSWDKIRGIDLVAFATVCDMIPLKGESRVVTWMGLQAMNSNPRVGLEAVAREAGVEIGDIEAYHLGYVLGPRVNAAGRIGDPMDALRLLTTHKDDQARSLASKLENLNRERQEITEELLFEARTRITEDGADEHLYFAQGSDWPEGIVGLVAGKIMEMYSRPVVLLSVGDDVAKGSARSISSFNVFKAIEQNSDMLENYGGHAQAAGFSIKPENIEKFKVELQTNANENLSEDDLEKVIKADAMVSVEDLDWDVMNIVLDMKPFGYRNKQPLFWIRNAKVLETRGVGDDKHMKLTLKGNDDETLECIFFNSGDFLNIINEGDRIDLLGNLDVNKWNGREQLQCKVIDLRPSEE